MPTDWCGVLGPQSGQEGVPLGGQSPSGTRRASRGAEGPCRGGDEGEMGDLLYTGDCSGR